MKEFNLHSYQFRHKVEFIPGEFTKGKIDVQAHIRSLLGEFDVSRDAFRGAKVLDIGTWSGGFAFAFEAMGAEVTAVDVMDPDKSGFNFLHGQLKSRVKFSRKTVYDLSAKADGEFDIVFFMGVFYHLKHPLLALEKINEVLKPQGRLFGGGTTCDLAVEHDGKEIVLEEESSRINAFPFCFFVADKLYNDPTNWFIPNKECLVAWLGRSGFECRKIVSSEGGLSNTGNRRSQSRFLAIKTGQPVSEHDYL